MDIKDVKNMFVTEETENYIRKFIILPEGRITLKEAEILMQHVMALKGNVPAYKECCLMNTDEEMVSGECLQEDGL
ncbi:hypothetical protein AGMMS49573_07960 [Endomicrobiia bacterium]|nr:hypothetical protein AGMMS49573_07960 [Endomicrobiia bacterium]